jgi:two-component system NtrC family sensor kinase
VAAKIIVGALGGTVVFSSVLFLFAMAVGDEIHQRFLLQGWDGTAGGIASSLIAVAGSGPGMAFLGFSLFGGLVGIALIGRDARIQKEVEELRRTRETLLDSLLSAERFATMGAMAAEIGHEINNYLAIACAQVELFSHAVEDSVGERAQRYIQSLSSQLGRMHTMSRGLMGFQSHRRCKEECDFNAMLTETLEFVMPLGRFEGVVFNTDLAEDLPPVMANAQQMQQVFLNLFNNAADACRGRSGRIYVSTCYWAEEDVVEIVVSDDGRGIPPDLMGRVFEAGFTTRADGHGYGLAVCKRIVEQHGARLSVRSEMGKGTTFVLTLSATTPQDPVFHGEAELEPLPASQTEQLPM